MEIRPVELIGRHVKLVPMLESHVDALFEAGKYPEIWEYMSVKVKTKGDMVRLVQHALDARDQGTEFPFVIIEQEENKVVGSTRFLDISAEHRHLEIGWTWLTPKVWRTCVNTECKYLLLSYCFEELGTIRVQLKTDARNLRSQRAIERIGAVREGVFRRHRIVCEGYVRDSVYYSIIDSEWPFVKNRLEKLIRID
nr:GNAT family protein [Kyrpidia sp.]